MKARDDVVVLVALAVVAHGGLVDGGLRGARGRWSSDARCWRRPPGRGLEVGQRPTRVTPGQAYEVGAGVVVELGRRRASPRSSVERLVDHLGHVVVGQRLQAQQQAAREQRADDREERVLRGRGDEGHPAVLDAGQQRVLLGLGEAVHLVDEEHRLLPAAGQLGPGAVDGGPHLLDACRDRRDLDEAPAGLLADDRGDGGLAGAGRPPQQQRHRLVALDQAAQRRPGGAQLLLADELVDRARSHPDRQRCRGVGVGARATRRPGRLRTWAREPGAGCPAPGISNKPSTSVSIPRRCRGASVRPPVVCLVLRSYQVSS